MPRQHHQESRNLFVREARKLCQKEFKRWFRLATEVNPLMRYFKEQMLPIPTLYVMGQEDHMFLAPVREQVAGYASSSLAMIQRCGHVCSVEQLDHFNRQSWRLSQRRHVSALNAWLGSSFKPLHRAHFWACSACLSCLRDGINCDSLSQYLVSGKTCGEINTPSARASSRRRGYIEGYIYLKVSRVVQFAGFKIQTLAGLMNRPHYVHCSHHLHNSL